MLANQPDHWPFQRTHGNGPVIYEIQWLISIIFTQQSPMHILRTILFLRAFHFTSNRNNTISLFTFSFDFFVIYLLRVRFFSNIDLCVLCILSSCDEITFNWSLFQFVWSSVWKQYPNKLLLIVTKKIVWHSLAKSKSIEPIGLTNFYQIYSIFFIQNFLYRLIQTIVCTQEFVSQPINK